MQNETSGPHGESTVKAMAELSIPRRTVNEKIQKYGMERTRFIDEKH